MFKYKKLKKKQKSKRKDTENSVQEENNSHVNQGKAKGVNRVRSPVRRLMSFCLGEDGGGGKLFAIGCLLGLMSQLGDVFLPLLIGRFIDALAAKQFHSAWGHVELFVVFSVGSAWLEYLRNYLFTIFTQKSLMSMRRTAYSQTQRREMAFFESNSVGNLLSIMSGDITTIEQFLSYWFPTLLGTTIQVTSSVLIAGSYSTTFALLALAMTSLLLSFAVIRAKLLKPHFQAVSETSGAMSTNLENSISGIAVIKSFCNEPYELKRMTDSCQRVYNTSVRAEKRVLVYSPVVRTVFALVITAVLFHGGHSVMSGNLAIGKLATVCMLLLKLVWPMETLGFFVAQWARTAASADRVFSLIDSLSTMAECSDPSVSASDLTQKARRSGGLAVQFDAVFFSYNKDQQQASSATATPPVLQGLSFSIAPGQSCGFAGATGVGKSTVLKLLLRFYDADRGTVSIGGIDVRALPLRQLRNAISLVAQDPYLFDGSIRENILYACRSGANDDSQAQGEDRQIRTFDDVVRAAEVAQLHRHVMAMPDGYDTIVGERGIRLSGGQKQRLAIARAILKDAPLFAFDEATASVDSQTEQAIHAGLLKFTSGRSSIIVAHRLCTLRKCDTIFVLHEGRVFESGTHDQLVAYGRSGLYYQQWAVQTGDFYQ